MMYLEFRKPSILSLISFELHSRSKNKPKMIREVIKSPFLIYLRFVLKKLWFFIKLKIEQGIKKFNVPRHVGSNHWYVGYLTQCYAVFIAYGQYSRRQK